ncbi:MAG TPA: flagellar export chaperone FliS [Candidatus Hydrogenedentes bacterium]|nr:flagellar export chaperone FliS [Candidatus Hydrogenedentota bacterium]HOL77972.1 flagellar export chaperone FliS [Candidatus Hydrogenedentota bacterium]HPO87401.1 flagellar export chaperone FliS [Candidatus Hydrogenedentota bacterium]
MATTGGIDYGVYKRVDVETASQGKLVVMLFNGAIQRAEEAKRHILARNYPEAHNKLIQAQEIITELRSALDMKAGEIAHNLNRIYEYFQHLLIRANLRKETEPIDLCVELMTEMRDTWQLAFEKAQREQNAGANVPPTPPTPNVHGAAVMNITG